MPLLLSLITDALLLPVTALFRYFLHKVLSIKTMRYVLIALYHLVQHSELVKLYFGNRSFQSDFVCDLQWYAC